MPHPHTGCPYCGVNALAPAYPSRQELVEWFVANAWRANWQDTLDKFEQKYQIVRKVGA